MDNQKFSGMLVPKASLYLWIILVLVVVISFFSVWVAIPACILLLYLVYYSYRTGFKRRREIVKYIEDLTFNMEAATRNTLLKFPMPLAVVGIDGGIIWYNALFREIFSGEDLLGKSIQTIIPDLDPAAFGDGEGSGSEICSREIEIGGRHYTVMGSCSRTEGNVIAGGQILMLYFIDKSDLYELNERYEDEKACAGIIVIDNYDELMQSIEDEKHPQLLAEIDRSINSWLAFADGILRKYERDRYVFVFQYRHLKKFEEKKFDILDSVKEINHGNKIPVTLSIGLGVNGASLAENFRSAQAAIDIALGRGGDQAVIDDRKQFRFFGGKSPEIEKRTRVKARVMAYALRELIDKSGQVFIMGHENMDIDALGAALGVYRIARSRNRQAYIVLDRSNQTIDRMVEKISRNPVYENLFISRAEALERNDGNTLVVVVDTHRPSITECPELLEGPGRHVVVIDHHRKGTEFIRDALLTYQEPYASSTCELVTEIIQYLDDKIRLSPIETEALYAGIIVDTKSFTFKTGVRTFEAASYLRRHGLDTVSVKQLFQNDLRSYVEVSDIVRNAELFNENIAISTCPRDMKNQQLIAAKAADELLNLVGISAAFVLGYLSDGVFISGRSLGDINVQVILEKLGGGGHFSVAGAQLHGATLEDAKEKLKYAIMEYVEKNREG